jgi:deoxyribose-phosphate aldolase
MNLNRETRCVALVIVALILVFGGPAFASVEEEVGVVENALPEEIQAVDEEVGVVENALPEEIQAVDEETTEAEPTDIQTVTIIGTVGEDYVLVSKQGVTYGIAETEAGDVMGQYVGEEVKVKGIISVDDDQKFISVMSFDFVE